MLLLLLNLAASSGISGAGTLNDGADTDVGAGTVKIAATGTPGDGAEGVIGSDASSVSGSGVVADGADQDAGSGTLQIAGAAVPSDGADTAAGAGAASGPASPQEPVTLTMAKSQCRAEGTNADDDYLLGLIQSAREYVEAYCGVRLISGTVEMTFPRFADLDRLTQAPVQSIAEVTYLDANGVLQTLDSAVYEFVNVSADVLRPRIRLAYNQQWPPTRTAEDAVKVSAVVGYTIVPMPIIRAMLLLVYQWFDLRSPVQVDARGAPADIPNTVSALLSNYRR